MEGILARELKAWQKEFRNKNGGREPTRADMAKHPTIASTYDTWHALRKEVSYASSSSKARGSSRASFKRSKVSPVAESSREKQRSTSSQPASLPNPFKTPTKRGTSNFSFASPYGRTPTEAPSRKQKSADPFRTPSKPSSNASSQRTPGSAASVVDLKVFFPPQPIPSNSPTVVLSTATPSRLRAQIGQMSSSGFANTPSRNRLTAADAMLLEDLTPRTKARKRLRGEEVPPTPAHAKKQRKKFGGAGLAALEEGSASDGSSNAAGPSSHRGGGAGGGGGGGGLGVGKPLQRKVSAFGMAKMREAEEQEKVRRASAALESAGDEDDDEEIQSSPARPSPRQGEQAMRKGGYKPLLSLRGGLYDGEADEDQIMRERSPSSSQSPNGGSLSISRSRSRSSRSPRTAGTSPAAEDVMQLDLPVVVSGSGRASHRSSQPQPRVWTTVLSDNEEDSPKDMARPWPHPVGSAESREIKAPTTIVIRPYRHYGSVDQHDDASYTDMQQDDEDGDLFLAALSWQRKASSQLSHTRTPSPSSQRSNAGPSASLTLHGLTLRSPSSKANAARAAERRVARSHLRALHLLDDRDSAGVLGTDGNFEDVRALEEAARNQAQLMRASELAEGSASGAADASVSASASAQDQEAWVAPLAGKGKSWGEAKAGARIVAGQDGYRQKGRASGKAKALGLEEKRKAAEAEEREQAARAMEESKREGRGDNIRMALRAVRQGAGSQVLKRCGRGGVGEEEVDISEDEGSDPEEQDFLRAQAASDEDWASEVESDEYGLGDGRMDAQDVM